MQNALQQANLAQIGTQLTIDGVLTLTPMKQSLPWLEQWIELL